MKAENGEIINSFTRLLNYIYKNMAQTINQRIDALRALLKREGIDAFIIPSTDPHLSEYEHRTGNQENGYQASPVRQARR